MLVLRTLFYRSLSLVPVYELPTCTPPSSQLRKKKALSMNDSDVPRNFSFYTPGSHQVGFHFHLSVIYLTVLRHRFSLRTPIVETINE